MSTTLTLGKDERLKHRKVIGQLFSKGHSFLVYPYKVVWSATPLVSDFPVQAMFAVTKKSFKSAVKRNTMRRRIKEAYRLNKTGLYNYLIEKNISMTVGFVYLGQDLNTYKDTEVKIILILRRLTEEYEKASR